MSEETICVDCGCHVATFSYPRDVCDRCWINWYTQDWDEIYGEDANEEKQILLQEIWENHYDLTGQFPP